MAEEVTGTDLDWFFGPWLHGTGLVDYALEGVSVGTMQAGTSRVTVDVARRGGPRHAGANPTHRPPWVR